MSVFSKRAVLILFICAGMGAQTSVARSASKRLKKIARRSSLSVSRRRMVARNDLTAPHISQATSSPPHISQATSSPPLMPPRQLDDELPELGQATAAPSEDESSASSPAATGRQPIRLTFAGGALGKNGALQSDALGMQIYWGARIGVAIPLLDDRVLIRPGVGYFFRSSGSGYQNLLENIVEPGLNVQYVLVRGAGYLWAAGVSQTLQIAFNRTSNGLLSTWTPADYTYRLGPSATLMFGISRSVSLLVDAEASFNLNSPTTPVIGLLGGIAIGF